MATAKGRKEDTQFDDRFPDNRSSAGSAQHQCRSYHGGGNRFIELNKHTDSSMYPVMHTRSRHLGDEVAEYYTKLANSCLKEQEAKQVNAAWREHTRIVRGNPVRVYEGEKFILKNS